MTSLLEYWLWKEIKSSQDNVEDLIENEVAFEYKTEIIHEKVFNKKQN